MRKGQQKRGGHVRVGVLVHGDVLVTRAELVGTVLIEETIERRATRTTIEPEDDRIGGGLAGRRNEDVVVVLLGVGEIDVSRIHLDNFGVLHRRK